MPWFFVIGHQGLGIEWKYSERTAFKPRNCKNKTPLLKKWTKLFISFCLQASLLFSVLTE